MRHSPSPCLVASTSRPPPTKTRTSILLVSTQLLLVLARHPHYSALLNIHEHIPLLTRRLVFLSQYSDLVSVLFSLQNISLDTGRSWSLARFLFRFSASHSFFDLHNFGLLLVSCPPLCNRTVLAFPFRAVPHRALACLLCYCELVRLRLTRCHPC